MCQGIAIFADDKRAFYGKGTNSHSITAEQHKISEDNFRHYEYLWWEKKLQEVHMGRVAEDILKGISKDKSFEVALSLVLKNFYTQTKLAKWLKGVPDEWDKLFDPKFKTLAKKVNPLLLTFQDKIAKFKKQPIEKYNPYQATKLPSLKKLKSFKKLRQVGGQVWGQVWDQVGGQVWDQVGGQVRDQVGATSYWAVKLTLGLPIKHWFFDFLKLGIMIVFVKGKVKVFGKKGMYLGEYDESDLVKKSKEKKV